MELKNLQNTTISIATIPYLGELLYHHQWQTNLRNFYKKAAYAYLLSILFLHTSQAPKQA
jgi:hypothetical protein